MPFKQQKKVNIILARKQNLIKAQSLYAYGLTAISGFQSEEKEQYVHSLFSRIAGCYDTMNKIMSFNLDTAWRKAAAVKTGVLPGDAVLDCCCGTGALTQPHW